MEAKIVKIGNFLGVKLKRNLLEKYKISDKVELILKDDFIILKPISEPRKGWDKAFAEMRKNNDDKLLINDVFEEDNIEEW